VSLVEKALKKLHEQRSTAESARNAGARRPADAGVDTSAAVASAPAMARPEPVPAALAPVPAAAPAPVPVVRNGKVVTLNLATLRAEGLLAAEEEQRRVASEYRQIKRPLIATALGKGTTPPIANGRVIMVASALPGEGKTFTSVNLAFNMALEKDTSVLLVDADLPKPQISRVFRVSEEPGLVDCLVDESKDIESFVLPTSVRGLSFLPAGKSSGTATELLASERMERIVADLLKRDPKRIVLFDTSPLLLTTESRALAGVVGQVVIVVRAESTTRRAVLEALEYLGEEKTVGLVLNQSRAEPTHSYYGYGDYYGDAGRVPE
jgi:protein-tyrosine kinase